MLATEIIFSSDPKSNFHRNRIFTVQTSYVQFMASFKRDQIFLSPFTTGLGLSTQAGFLTSFEASRGSTFKLHKCARNSRLQIH